MIELKQAVLINYLIKRLQIENLRAKPRIIRFESTCVVGHRSFVFNHF